MKSFIMLVATLDERVLESDPVTEDAEGALDKSISEYVHDREGVVRFPVDGHTVIVPKANIAYIKFKEI